MGETWKDHDQSAIKFDNKIANPIKLKAVIPANSKWSVAKESVIFGTDNSIAIDSCKAVKKT